MKKMSNKGFTLIELLAVITIMGILMMVAIPAVSRTIENSRRDTFASVAGEYLSAVRNGVLSDEIECYHGGQWRVASSLPDGDYYFPICTTDLSCEGYASGSKTVLAPADIVTSTTDLLESGGKSPFGSADLYGYVTWKKETKQTSGGDTKSKVEYKILLRDSGNHGLASEKTTAELKRSNVSTNVSTTTDASDAASDSASPTSSTTNNNFVNTKAGATPCKVS